MISNIYNFLNKHKLIMIQCVYRIIHHGIDFIRSHVDWQKGHDVLGMVVDVEIVYLLEYGFF